MRKQMHSNVMKNTKNTYVVKAYVDKETKEQITRMARAGFTSESSIVKQAIAQLTKAANENRVNSELETLSTRAIGDSP